MKGRIAQCTTAHNLLEMRSSEQLGVKTCGLN